MKGDYNSRTNTIEKEGYAILSSDDVVDIGEVFERLFLQYDKLVKAGENNLGIDYKEFHLYVEALQNSFTINTKYFKKICEYFSEINITYIEEKS